MPVPLLSAIVALYFVIEPPQIQAPLPPSPPPIPPKPAVPARQFTPSS
jgi:hypothetical protein